MCSLIYIKRFCETKDEESHMFTYIHIHTHIVKSFFLKAQHQCPFKSEQYMTGQQKPQEREINQKGRDLRLIAYTAM